MQWGRSFDRREPDSDARATFQRSACCTSGRWARSCTWMSPAEMPQVLAAGASPRRAGSSAGLARPPHSVEPMRLRWALSMGLVAAALSPPRSLRQEGAGWAMPLRLASLPSVRSRSSASPSRTVWHRRASPQPPAQGGPTVCDLGRVAPNEALRRPGANPPAGARAGARTRLRSRHVPRPRVAAPICWAVATTERSLSHLPMFHVGFDPGHALFEVFACTAQSGCDGSRLQFQRFGDVGHGQPLDVVQHKHSPQLFAHAP